MIINPVRPILNIKQLHRFASYAISTFIPFLERRKDIFGLKVRDVMIANPKIIRKEKLAAEALRLMEKHGITCLVVVDERKKPIGIIHLHDILRSGVF